MSDQNQPLTLDHSFSVFTLGLTLGAVGALILSTKEGRQIAKNISEAISELKLNEKVATKAEEIIEEVKTTVKGEVPPLPPLRSNQTNRYFHK